MTSRTSDLARRVLAFARDQDLLPPGCAVLCALSGGTDSMALLALLQELAPAGRLTLTAAHYNHGLRGEESNRDEAFVRQWCAQEGIPLLVGRGDVAHRAKALGQGIEETARAMRYDFLTQAAAQTGAQAIATAHNADDNVETILLHLIRGAGLDGLTGIPPRRGPFIRPLLAVPREDLAAWLTERGIPHVEDSSNADQTYARNRLRRQVLPVLRELNPNLAATVAAALPHLRADRDLLYDLARETADTAWETPNGLALSASALAALPRPAGVRAAKLILARLGRFQFSAPHWESMLDLAAGDNPSARLDLPQGLTLRRDYDRLTFSLGEESPRPLDQVTVPAPGTYPLSNGWTVRLQAGTCPPAPTQGPESCWLRPAFPLTLRPRRPGDTLRLPGRREKPLKKWYIDEKIPRLRRDSLPVLADADGVVAAAGLGPQETCLARPGEPALQVTFTPPPQTHTERT